MNDLSKPLAYRTHTKIAFLVAVAAMIYMWVAHLLIGFAELRLPSRFAFAATNIANVVLLITVAIDLRLSERRLGKFSERLRLLDAYEPNIFRRIPKAYSIWTLLSFIALIVCLISLPSTFSNALHDMNFDLARRQLNIGTCAVHTSLFVFFVSMFVDLLAFQNRLAKFRATGVLENESNAREAAQHY